MDEFSSKSEPAPLFADERWFDPIEAGLRERVRGFIEELIEKELSQVLGRHPGQRGPAAGYRHGRRPRQLAGSFGAVEIAVPRAWLRGEDGQPANGAARHCRVTRGAAAKSTR